MGRTRRFQITINNWTQEEYDTWWTLPCKYMVIGKEVGEQLTPHIHVYVEFENGKTLETVKSITPRGHIEVCKGSSLENRAYVVKDGDFAERGNRSMTQDEKGATEQLRWAEAKKFAISGELDKIDDQIFVTHYGNLKRIQKDHLPAVHDLREPCAYWLYGESGNGKSQWARNRFGSQFYSKDASKWWDGYQNEEVALIEDIDPGQSSMIRQFKIWADKYAFVAETKGGMLRIRPRIIVFTSQYTIEEVFGIVDRQSVDAMKRRCKEEYVPHWKGTIRESLNAEPSVIATTPTAPVAIPAF